MNLQSHWACLMSDESVTEGSIVHLHNPEWRGAWDGGKLEILNYHNALQWIRLMLVPKSIRTERAQTTLENYNWVDGNSSWSSYRNMLQPFPAVIYELFGRVNEIFV